MTEKFGELIKRLREEQNVDIKDFSKKTGITVVELKCIEAGTHYPHFYSLKVMSDALNCDCNFLYDKLVEAKGK